MSARNDLTKGLWSKALLLAAALALLSGSASGRPPAPGASDNGPTPVEQQRQKQIDSDYKAATKNIPNQKPKDPWGDFGRQHRPARANNSLLAASRRPGPLRTSRYVQPAALAVRYAWNLIRNYFKPKWVIMKGRRVVTIHDPGAIKLAADRKLKLNL
jgi:hypothetical protein